MGCPVAAASTRRLETLKRPALIAAGGTQSECKCFFFLERSVGVQVLAHVRTTSLLHSSTSGETKRECTYMKHDLATQALVLDALGFV